MGVCGLAYDFYPKAESGEKVRNLRFPDGTKPSGRERFRVAFNSYTLASGGGRFALLRKIAERPNSRLDMTGIDTRSAVAEYIRKHSPLRLEADASVTMCREEETTPAGLPRR